MQASPLNPPSPSVIAPPFTVETAVLKVRAAEDAWNSRDPIRVSLAYTEDSVGRNRGEFPVGRDQIRQFLTRKWVRELDYRLVKELWGFRENRIAVRFQYEWHDDTAQWFRSYGNELWEFDDRGLMRRARRALTIGQFENPTASFFGRRPVLGRRNILASQTWTSESLPAFGETGCRWSSPWK